MEKANYEWLVSKLREAEKERDEAIEHAKNVELDNLRLRIKLRSIADYADDEQDIEDFFPDIEDGCPCIPEENTDKNSDKSGMPYV